jgi:hypothetical protein
MDDRIFEMFFGSPADQEVAHEMLRDPQTLKEFVADIMNVAAEVGDVLADVKLFGKKVKELQKERERIRTRLKQFGVK